ncbi:hypothetical protein K8T06_00590 [bacterium]|nr:hypothetical protein [bacterium]
MYYLAHFLFASSDTQDRTFGYFTCLTQAADTEIALEKFEDQILEISENSDLFDEVKTVFLEDVIEFETLPESAILTRFEMFAGDRPPSANITLPDQAGADSVTFYRPASEEEESVDGILTPFIEFNED